MSSTQTQRITLATVKAFIKRHREYLLIQCKSEFDGMVDCVMPCKTNPFELARTPLEGYNHSNTLGIAGAWFVFGSRDYFQPYEDDEVRGIEVTNCCGKFILAVRKDLN